MTNVILAIDVGSSSIRCTGYEYHGVLDSQADWDLDYSSPQLSPSSQGPHVMALEGVNHTIRMSSIIPNTGHIRIQQVLLAADTCVDEVLRLLRQKRGEEKLDTNSSYQIVAIGFSTFVTNLVAVDMHGDPVGEAATLSCACNREDVVKECQKLRDNLGPEKLEAMYQRTGTPLHPSYALPQLLAFYHNEDNQTLATRIDKWKTISSICVHRWSGKLHFQMPISYSEASWTGMLSFRDCDWDDEATHIFETCQGIVQYPHCEYDEDDVYMDDDCIDLLPPLVDYDAALPFLTVGIPPYAGDGSENPYWYRWPELRSKKVRFFLGIGDGVAANVGSKCGGYPTSASLSASHRINVTMGTNASCRCVLPLSMRETQPSQRHISVSPGLFCHRVHRDHILVGGALTDGGSVVESARSLLNLQSDESFNVCMEKVSEMYAMNSASPSPGPDTPSSAPSGVTMVPFLSGERSTGFRGGAQDCSSGVTRETTPAHTIYACLESVILRLGCIMKLVNEARSSEGHIPNQGIIIASGNALEWSPLWQQMLADCSSMDVIIDADSSSEVCSRGVAMMVAGALFKRELGNPLETCNFEEPLPIARKTEPNAATQERWRAAIARQESLIDAVSSAWSVA